MRPQLFLFHFAGGNKYSYTFLTPFLKNKFECIRLELPGRGNRFGQPLLNSKKAAIEDYYNQILSHLTGAPFVLFGHSMGAVLTFEIASRLEKENKAPKAIIVTGNAGPNIERKEIRYNLSDEDFINALAKLGGTPSEVIDNKELFQLFNPILCADFEVVENPDIPVANKLEVTPIYAMMGKDEENADSIDNWMFYSEKEVSTQVLDGGHFFIHDHPETLAQKIIYALKKVSV